jgi:HAD superfamily hydrolase (TIGR01484 family)
MILVDSNVLDVITNDPICVRYGVAMALPSFLAVPASQIQDITAIFFDVDDTITWEGRLPSEALLAIEAARAAGIACVPVTGRSLAWGELLLRWLDCPAVVAESGAVALVRSEGRTHLWWHEADDQVRASLRAKRERATAQVMTTMPVARLALDNVGRAMDTAFDLNEDGPALSAAEAAAIRTTLEHEGLVCFQSSVHINAFALGPNGPFDKATMAARIASDALHLQDGFQHIVYVGDSSNDGAMFAAAPWSVGVANVAAHLPTLEARHQAPKFIVDKPGGFGFAQVVSKLLTKS